MSRLPRAFFLRPDVARIGRDLLGKHLFTRSPEGQVTGGVIVETEAYGGANDRASHAWRNRQTERNEAMFREGGIAYVYLCYGMHWLLNVVTNREGIAEAVLIRAIAPTHGIPTMLRRRGKAKLDRTLTGGPAALARALGITGAFNGLSLRGNVIWLEDRGRRIPAGRISAGPRVGVAYAGAAARRPWRFKVVDSPWTSRAK